MSKATRRRSLAARSPVANIDDFHRVRQLQEEPHSQKIAEAAVGLGVENGKKKEDDAVEMED